MNERLAERWRAHLRLTILRFLADMQDHSASATDSLLTSAVADVGIDADRDQVVAAIEWLAEKQCLKIERVPPVLISGRGSRAAAAGSRACSRPAGADMARKSKVTALPGPVKAAVDELLKTGRYTLDDIVAHIRKLAAEQGVPPEQLPSRASLGRYSQQFEKSAAKMRQAREIAGSWIDQLKDDPESKVGRLLIEMARTAAFQQLVTMNEAGDDAPPDAAEIKLLAQAIRDLEIAGRHSVERELRIRKEVIAKAAEEVAKTAKAQGLTADTVAAIRQSVLGVAT